MKTLKQIVEKFAKTYYAHANYEQKLRILNIESLYELHELMQGTQYQELSKTVRYIILLRIKDLKEEVKVEK